MWPSGGALCGRVEVLSVAVWRFSLRRCSLRPSGGALYGRLEVDTLCGGALCDRLEGVPKAFSTTVHFHRAFPKAFSQCMPFLVLVIV